MKSAMAVWNVINLGLRPFINEVISATGRTMPLHILFFYLIDGIHNLVTFFSGDIWFIDALVLLNLSIISWG